MTFAPDAITGFTAAITFFNDNNVATIPNRALSVPRTLSESESECGHGGFL